MTGHASLKVHDAAIERQSVMREDQYKHFRWTKTTVRTAMWGVFLIPAGLFFTVYASQNKWDWTGKRRGQSLAVAPKS